jgi:hypothetical protein
MDDRGYEPPAIAERVPVGDPLILGLYTSPHWRPEGDEETAQ